MIEELTCSRTNPVANKARQLPRTFLVVSSGRVKMDSPMAGTREASTEAVEEGVGGRRDGEEAILTRLFDEV